jgi:DNA (cytosine-5)-methyltransferase 1
MDKPRILDLFCGAGGAGMGYYRAGFDVVGVDINRQPRYPFTFVQGDALEYLRNHGREFDAVHASPPCQEYSRTRFLRDACQEKKGYKVARRAMLIDQVRDLLEATHRPYIIENVPSSPLVSPIVLCGSMFGLQLRRHRLFESSILLMSPGQCSHTDGFYNAIGGKIRGYGDYSSGSTYISSATGETRKREGYPGKAVGQLAMGIDWMTVAEMCEAIPPVFTEWIGRQMAWAVMSAV